MVLGLRRRAADPDAQREIRGLQVQLAEARAIQHRLEHAFDVLPFGIALANGSGRVTWSNPSSRAFVGHTRVLIDEAVERLLHTAVTSNRPAAQTLQLVGPPRVVVSIEVTPLSEGGAVATIHDISDRERVDAVRTDFVANISHELKTPVGGIAVLAEALAAEDEPDVMRRLAVNMVDEAHRVSGTIDDLLELSRIELGGELLRAPTSVDEVLHDAVRRTAPAAAARRVAVSLGACDLTVSGDRRQLTSAVANLIDNAIKYSEEGSEVTIAARAEARRVVIDVTDHGVGIPAKDLDRVFERFYRVDRARSRDTGGTGLGLSIVRHVATNHGGEVTVTSREGEGSTFSLALPTVPDE